MAATETAVKQAKLDQYRIVYFATHGLVAGDLETFAKDKAEPALALSIPEKPDDFDDGLLTASEIAQLKLDADWAVLSACNTAAEDEPGAEGMGNGALPHGPSYRAHPRLYLNSGRLGSPLRPVSGVLPTYRGSIE